MNWLLVLAGGVIGAPLRYLTDRAVQSWRSARFPWGTLTVNVLGCLLLGLVTGATAAGADSSGVRLFLAVGLCGALTTFSTFSHETLRLAEEGALRSAAANVLLTVGAGIGALLLGGLLTRALSGG